MVIDLNKCIGCQTCTVGCKQLWTNDPAMEYMWWNIVTTVPGRGTPRDWEKMGGGFDADGKARTGRLPTNEEFGIAWNFNYEEVFFEGKGTSVHLKPTPEPTWGPNWEEDQGAGEYPNSYYFYLPRLCNHCTRPACLEACPRKAIVKNEENGTVLIDEDKCHGYRFCMEACPYKRIYFNPKRFIGQKCILCFPRVEKGVAPGCVRMCPGRARHFGYLDDEAGQVFQLVSKWRVAIPLHPEYGTQPNIYYVPPVLPPPFDSTGNPLEAKPRVPAEYLRSLFGPAADEALRILNAEWDKTRAGQKSDLMDILISRRWHDMLKPFDQNPAQIEA
ncbi:MAG: 4Fe-4S dicluster domain-containing protein [Nitrospirae bacterium]|nr:4Fe-4S dicluster domain-containing protein [Nitrospirota bacterium]